MTSPGGAGTADGYCNTRFNGVRRRLSGRVVLAHGSSRVSYVGFGRGCIREEHPSLTAIASMPTDHFRALRLDAAVVAA